MATSESKAAFGVEPVDDRRAATGRTARYDRRGATSRTVSVVVPTFNEADNIVELLDRVAAALTDFDYEIVVVDDDSPDLTWQIAESHGAEPAFSGRVTVLRRLNASGLSSAVLDGMALASGRVLAVIDADLQHDESALPAIVAAVLDDGADICLGTRATDGGSFGAFGPARRAISWSATQLARQVLGVTASDPMSGYFAVSRERFEAIGPSVNPRGFKILLEFLARGPRPQVSEVGYTFRLRARGETKLSGSVAVAYLVGVLGLAVSTIDSLRFGRYLAVALVALCLRLSLGSMAELTGAPGLTFVAIVEFSILMEFGLHERFSVLARRPPGCPRLVPLAVFHAIGLQAVLAQRGLSALLASFLNPIDGAWKLIAAPAVATVAVMVTITAAGVLSGALVWPTRPASIQVNSGRR